MQDILLAMLNKIVPNFITEKFANNRSFQYSNANIQSSKPTSRQKIEKTSFHNHASIETPIQNALKPD